MKPDGAASAASHVLHMSASRVALTVLILVNVAAFVIETTTFAGPFARTFQLLEIASVAVFGVEYLLRLLAASTDPRFATVRAPALRWAATPLAIVDLLAILPTLLGLGDLRVLRALRLLRLLKLGRYNASLQLLGRVLRRTQATLLTTLFLVLLALLLTASVLYYAEHSAQPDKFSSIPASMWWAIATLTTTGYGDVSPVTTIGRLLAGATSIIGIGLVALPVGILASAFMEELKRSREDEGSTCPHCGGTVHAPGAT